MPILLHEDRSLAQSRSCRPQGHQFLAAGLISCLASASIGTVLGFSAILLPQLESEKVVLANSSEASWIASLSNIGQLLGALLTGWVANQFGRKRAIMLLCLPLAFGWTIVGLSRGSVHWICIGRVCQGIGIMSSVTQVYLIEIADVNNRSLFGASGALSVSAGITFVYILGAICHWTCVCGVCGGLVILVFLSMLGLPETPNWLALQGQKEKAKEVLEWLHGKGNSNIQSELEALQPNASESLLDEEQPSIGSRNEPSKLWREFKKPEGHRPFLLLICIFFLQQSTGSFAVIFYAVTIFQDIGVASDPYLAAILTGCIRLFGTLLGTLLAKRYSGKWLMFTSALLMALGMFLLGLNILGIEKMTTPEANSLTRNPSHENHLNVTFDAETPTQGLFDNSSQNGSILSEERIEWLAKLLLVLPIVEIVLYMLAFGVGVGTVPWLLLGELCPSSIKGLTSGLTVFVAFGTIFVVVKLFPSMISVLGQPYTYWVFGMICLVTALFTVGFVPDTKGQTFQQIEAQFRGPISEAFEGTQGNEQMVSNRKCSIDGIVQKTG